MPSRKVLSFGELLIDFHPRHISEGGEQLECYQKFLGGAPANVAVALAKLGGDAYFVGKTGRDFFGDFLLDELRRAGVRTDCCLQSDEVATPLAFVSHDASGERDFHFYRHPAMAADLAFHAKDWRDEWFADAAYFHCGSNCQVTPASHASTRTGMEMAVKHGVTVSYDPNLRPVLWEDSQLLVQRVRELFPLADLIKMSDIELQTLFPNRSPDEVVVELLAMKCRLLILTRGSNGCLAFTEQGDKFDIPGIKGNTIDTAAAGDTFIAAFLFSMLEKNIAPQEVSLYLEEFLNFANRSAAISTTRRGSATSAPTLEEVLNFGK